MLEFLDLAVRYMCQYFGESYMQFMSRIFVKHRVSPSIVLGSLLTFYCLLFPCLNLRKTTSCALLMTKLHLKRLRFILTHHWRFSQIVCSTQYYAALEGISIDDQRIEVDPQQFGSPSSGGGTIFDSGTSLAFLVNAIYGPFISAVSVTWLYGDHRSDSRRFHDAIFHQVVFKIILIMSIACFGSHAITLCDKNGIWYKCIVSSEYDFHR